MGVRVCHVSDIHKTDDNRIVLKECRSLKNAGYEVHVIAVGESQMFEGIVLHGITATSRIKRYFGSKRNLLRKAISIDAQVYHLHDPELLQIAKSLKKKTNAKIIYDSHEDYKEQLAIKNSLPVRVMMKCWYALTLWKAKKYLDGFIFPCVNPRLEKEISPLKLTTVDNFPLLSYQTEGIQHIEKIKNSVCYIGSISRDRGVIQAIKATAKANAKLELVGKIDDDSLYEELINLPEWKCVNYYGLVPHSEALEIAAKTEVGLCCLTNSGQYAQSHNLATKVYEYFLNNVAVLLNRTDYNVEINNKFDFALIVDDINNIDDYANRIKELLSNDGLRKKLASNGYKYVISHANWISEEKKLLSLYEEII